MTTQKDGIAEIEYDNQRMSRDAALHLLKQAGTAELMYRADRIRRAKHETRVYYVHSLNINPTNLCANKCGLCAFWRDRDAAEGYVLSLEQATERLHEAAGWGLTDLHVVGGLTEHLRLDYFVRLFERAKEILSSVIIQGLTAVEVDWLARLEKMPVIDVLRQLRAAGLDAMPGGGAEIFDDSVRRRICPNKISADEWLSIHEQAHRLGIKTNATMLFGHIETCEDIIDHLLRLRELQDRTGGFQAFCPLPFHPSGTRIDVTSPPGGQAIARVVAVSRIVLDNFSHIRVLANYMDRKLLQTMLYSGTDDVGGTSINEQIARAAGAPDNSKFTSKEELDAFIRRLGFTPVLCNSIYDRPMAEQKTVPAVSLLCSEPWKETLEKTESGERLTLDEASLLHDHAPFQELGRVADKRRHEKVPLRRCTFIIDRNISFTNVCTVGCRFCAYHKRPNRKGGFVMSIEEIVRRVMEAADMGATQIMLQGGLNPDLGMDFYENMLRTIKERAPAMWLHSLSPAEVFWLAARNGLSLVDALKRLRSAGLDSLPGGGAEILVDDVRQKVSPRKITADQWFAVMEAAHSIGMGTTATMVYGLGETTAQRIEHMVRVRDLQDRTGGFRAFIPWSFQPNHTKLPYAAPSGVEYLKVVAIARLVLDNVDHIQAGWVTEGPDMVELALNFGADDFGGVLMEESVVKATGVSFRMSLQKMLTCIRRAGLTPAVRDTQYHILGTYDRRNRLVTLGGG